MKILSSNDILQFQFCYLPTHSSVIVQSVNVQSYNVQSCNVQSVNVQSAIVQSVNIQSSIIQSCNVQSCNFSVPQFIAAVTERLQTGAISSSQSAFLYE